MRTVLFVAFMVASLLLAPLAIWGQVPEEVGRTLDGLIEKLETQKLSKVDALPIATKYWKEYPEEERAWLAVIRSSGVTREKLTRLAIRKFPESRAIAEERLRDTQPAEAIDLLGELVKNPGWEEWVGERREYLRAGGHPNTDMTRVESHRQLIVGLVGKQQDDMARHFVSKARAKWPKDEELLALEAIQFAREGSFEKAIEQYQKLKGHPYPSAPMFHLADLLLTAMRYEQALTLIEQQEGLQRRQAPTFWFFELKALALIRLGKLDEAAKALTTKSQPQAEACRTVLTIQLERARKDEEKAWQIAKPWIDQLQVQKGNGLFLPPKCLAGEYINVFAWAKGKSEAHRKFLQEMESNFASPKFGDRGPTSAANGPVMGLQEVIRSAQETSKRETDPARIDSAKEYLASKLAESGRYVEAAKVMAELAVSNDDPKNAFIWPHQVRVSQWINFVRQAEVEVAFERDPMRYFEMRAELLKSPPTFPAEAIQLHRELQAKYLQSCGRVGAAIVAADLENQHRQTHELLSVGGSEADAFRLIVQLHQLFSAFFANKRTPTPAETLAWDQLHASIEKLTKATCPETDAAKRLTFWRDWWNANSKRIVTAEMAYLETLVASKATAVEVEKPKPKADLDPTDVARLHVLRISAGRDTTGDRGTTEMLALLRAKPLQSEYWAGMAFLLDRYSDQMADLCIRRAIELMPENEAYLRQRAEMASQGFALLLYEELATRLKDREAARAMQIFVELGYVPQPWDAFEQEQPVYIDLIKAKRFDDLDFLLSRVRKGRPKEQHQLEQMAALALAAQGKFEEAADHFEKVGCKLPQSIRIEDRSAREFLLVDYLAAMRKWDLVLKCIDAGYRDEKKRVPTPLGEMRMIEALALANLSRKGEALKLFPFAEEKNLVARFVEVEVLEILNEKELARDLVKKVVEPLRPKLMGMRPNYPSEVGYGASDAIRVACDSALARIRGYYPEKLELIAEHWKASESTIGDRWRWGAYQPVEAQRRSKAVIEFQQSRIDQKAPFVQMGNWLQLWYALTESHQFSKAAQSFVKSQTELAWTNPYETKLKAAQSWCDFIRKHELESEFPKNPLAAVELFVVLVQYRPELEKKGTYIGFEVPSIDVLREKCNAHPRLGALLISSFFEPRTYGRPTRKDLIDLLAELSDERDMPIVVNQLDRSREKSSPGALTAEEAETARKEYQKALSAALVKWFGVKPEPGSSIDDELRFWNEWWEKESPRILEKYTPK